MSSDSTSPLEQEPLAATNGRHAEHQHDTVPLIVPEPLVDEEKSDDNRPPVNILLVDDRTDKLTAFQSILETLEENIISCRSGKDALRALLKDDFAVILLDVNMPGLDGFETASLIRKRQASASTPIIFVSALADTDNHVTRGYALGAVDYILSPVVPEILRAKVCVFVELYRKTQQIARQAELLRQIDLREHRLRLSETQDKLQAETKRNRFFSHSVDLLAVANVDGIILKANPSWSRILGWRLDQVEGRHLSDLGAPEQKEISAAVQERLDRGDVGGFETCLITSGGERRWIEWNVTRDETERLFYLFGRDFTDRRAADEEIRSLNQKLDARLVTLTEINRELDTFSYSISHDLRAPLRTIRSFTEILVESNSENLNDEGRDCAQRIVAAAARMDQLTRDLLAYSRISRDELTLRTVDVDLTIREVIALNQSAIDEKQAQIEVIEPLGIVMAQATMLTQALSNLLGNAIKFVPTERRPQVKIWSDQGEANVRIFVDDNGIGISPEYYERIFNVFTRLHHHHEEYEGMGIGLSIARKAVERMNGKLGIEAGRNGEGCCFWIELPRGLPSADVPANEPFLALHEEGPEAAAEPEPESPRPAVATSNEETAPGGGGTRKPGKRKKSATA